MPLRKVEVQRSPGGTPMKERAGAADPGHYLAMALKRKFKVSSLHSHVYESRVIDVFLSIQHVYASPDEKRSPVENPQRRRRDSFYDDVSNTTRFATHARFGARPHTHAHAHSRTLLHITHAFTHPLHHVHVHVHAHALTFTLLFSQVLPHACFSISG